MRRNTNLKYLRPVEPDEEQAPTLQVNDLYLQPKIVILKATDDKVKAEANAPSEATLKDWRYQWSGYLSVMKPITWVPVVWSFWCGTVAAGGLRFEFVSISKLLVGFLLSGPLLCGMGQSINDYFDREVDAINEPWRPIPSGRLNLNQVYQLTGLLGFLGLLAAYYLGETVLLLAFLGIFLAHNYSAPPFRLKANTWLGPFSSAVSYILLPWLAASSVFGGFTWHGSILAVIYTVAGLGIMILNDFKSIKGDFQLKLPSVPVVYGSAKAARLAVSIMDGAQLTVTGLLLVEGRLWAALIMGLLILPQLWFQYRFIKKPLALTVWYQARAQNFLVLGMLVAAWVAL